MRGVVPRYAAVRLECLDREGNAVDLVAKEFFARVIQHETDHLNGIVYVDRIRDMRTFSHIAEWQRYWLGVREQSDQHRLERSPPRVAARDRARGGRRF